MTQIIEFGDGHIELEAISRLALSYANPSSVIVSLAPGIVNKVNEARQTVENVIGEGRIVYGVTTGLGEFRDRIISMSQLQQLQRNILRSHAAGVGKNLPLPLVRAMMAIRLLCLIKGHSGVRMAVVETLISMINLGVYPNIPVKGSLGASGDLAPLAHMSLPMIGEGEAYFNGEYLTGLEAMNRANIPTLELAGKEALSLINGTALITTYATFTILKAEVLSKIADLAASLSLEALNGTLEAFDERIHRLRPHPGQIKCAENIRYLLRESTLTNSGNSRFVHDPYSLRCVPQVHGASRDAIKNARRTVEIELNSVTDNPLIVFDSKPPHKPSILSGGNFHGQPLALAMDFLKIALAELGSISERRVAFLVDDKANQGVLPPFLIQNGGLNSGFMVAQYTAAALVSENKVLSHPASVDSIPSSANVEDHVSMGTIAARQAYEVAQNVETVLAIELLLAAQAVEYSLHRENRVDQLGKGTQAAYMLIRERVPFIETDVALYQYIESVRTLIVSGALVDAVGMKS